MKRSPKVLHTLNMGIFPCEVLLTNGFAYNEIIEELEKQGCKEWAFGLTMHKELLESGTEWCALRSSVSDGKKDSMYFYIFLKNQFVFNDESYCLLAHEILHICQFFLPNVLKRDNEYECEAYLHTHLMRQCLEVLRTKK